MITYQSFADVESINAACLVAISHRLFQPGWLMRKAMAQQIANGKMFTQFVIAYEDDKPVGACFQCHDALIMTFVRKNYRRQGIGSGLLNTLPKNEKSFVMTGVQGSRAFYLKQGLRINDNHYQNFFVDDVKPISNRQRSSQANCADGREGPCL